MEKERKIRTIQRRREAINPVERAPDKMLKSTHKGKLKIGEKELECYVLDNGTRVLSSRQAIRVLARGNQNVSTVMGSKRLKPFLSQALNAVTDFEKGILIEFHSGQPGIAQGVRAELFMDMCNAYSDARDAGALTKQQEHIGIASNKIIKSCAKIGIIALIDEATGYQAIRPKDELQTKLQLWLAAAPKEWELLFPMALWEELARLIGYTGDITHHRPQVFGRYVNEFIYGLLDADLPAILKERNPHPSYGRNHHQHLTAEGRIRARQQIWMIIGVLKTCETIGEARARCERASGRKIIRTPPPFTLNKICYSPPPKSYP